MANSFSPPRRNAMAPVQPVANVPMAVAPLYSAPTPQDAEVLKRFLLGAGKAALAGIQFPGDLMHDAARSLRAGRPAGVYADLVETARRVSRDPAAVPGMVVNALKSQAEQARSSPGAMAETMGGMLDVRNMLKPKPQMMSAGPYTPKPLPKLIRDNPGGDWLTQKRKYAEAQGNKPSGAFKYPGELTASYEDTVYLPVSTLERIPGENMEQYNVRQHSLDWLTKEMSEKNRLPTYEAGGKEFDNAPFITVDSKGRPFVTEGNHRIMVAKQLGWQYLPVEIRYFNGGELEEGPFKPENLKKFTKQIEP